MVVGIIPALSVGINKAMQFDASTPAVLLDSKILHPDKLRMC